MLCLKHYDQLSMEADDDGGPCYMCELHRLRVEVEAWRSGRLYIANWAGTSKFSVDGRFHAYDTIDDAVDALMEEE